MATNKEYIDYVIEQIKGVGELRSKKMFGEYMIYVNNKPILLVCDNTVYVKKADEIKELMECADIGFPYKGAKEHYILDVENELISRKVINALELVTKIPIPKKKNR